MVPEKWVGIISIDPNVLGYILGCASLIVALWVFYNLYRLVRWFVGWNNDVVDVRESAATYAVLLAGERGWTIDDVWEWAEYYTAHESDRTPDEFIVEYYEARHTDD